MLGTTMVELAIAVGGIGAVPALLALADEVRRGWRKDFQPLPLVRFPQTTAR